MVSWPRALRHRRYGLGSCKAWDQDVLSMCDASTYTDGKLPPSWCSMRWCFVHRFDSLILAEKFGNNGSTTAICPIKSFFFLKR